MEAATIRGRERGVCAAGASLLYSCPCVASRQLPALALQCPGESSQVESVCDPRGWYSGGVLVRAFFRVEGGGCV